MQVRTLQSPDRDSVFSRKRGGATLSLLNHLSAMKPKYWRPLCLFKTRQKHVKETSTEMGRPPDDVCYLLSQCSARLAAPSER